MKRPEDVTLSREEGEALLARLEVMFVYASPDDESDLSR